MSAFFNSEDDRRVEVDPVRHQYRVLSDAEKQAMTHIKDMGAGLIRAIEANIAGREAALAITKTEEAVMWAVKGLTR